MLNKILPLIFALVTLMTLPLQAHAEQRIAGGWIDSYEGSADAYSLARDGKALPVAIYKPLYVGDTIVVEKDHVLTIGRSDGTKQQVAASDGQFTVTEADRSTTIIDNFLQWAGDWFGQYAGDDSSVQLTAMTSRGDGSSPISMSLFPTGLAKLLPGQRSIKLFWEGGKMPFGITVHSQGDTDTILIQQDVTSSNILLEPINFSEGTYFLEIKDANETEVVRIDVVSEEQYPARPAALQNPGISGEVISNLEAMWLAGQEDGDWVLEAYQLVSNSGNEASAGALLRDALENGIVPLQPEG